MKFQRYVSIRRILALVSLFFLLLPVGGIYFLRIYESALIRQTESELISQGAFVSAIYQHAIQDELKAQGLSPESYGLPVLSTGKPENDIAPILPQLDLAKDSIRPARPQPFYTQDKLDPVAEQAGEKVLPVLQDAQHITLSGIKLLDYQGLVVTGEQEKGLSFGHVEEFQQARKGKPISLIRVRRMPEKPAAPLGSISRNANINVFVAMPILLHNHLVGVVWLNRTPIDLPQALYSKRVELAWTIIALLLATILIARLTSLTITRPIRALVEKTRLITQGDPEGVQPLKNPITREVSELSDNIAIMATTIQDRTDYIRKFTAHISHEFKTPLTAIRGSVELLQDNLDDMPQAQQKRFLNNISQDADRLGRLVSRLLELTRADLTEAPHQAVDLRPILEQLMARYPGETIQLKLTWDSSDTFKTIISPESLEAAMAHLVENSIQAGANQIDIAINKVDTSLVLDIRDNGPGISEANQKEIFTPFFTTKRDVGGTGLGLSIAHSLLERHKGSISLEPSEAGAHFRVHLPSA